MPEQESVAIAEQFARYRAKALPGVDPPGPAAVRRTVRLRRRRTVGRAVALVLAMAAGPVLGYAALHAPPPQPGPVEPTGSPSSSPSASRTASPSSTPSSSSPTPSLAAPDGRISRGQLLAATVSLPAWAAPAACPSGRVRLGTDPARDDTNQLVAIDQGDLDEDGATETVALVRCVFGTRGAFQVVAFDRDTGGRVITLGRVTATARPTPGWVTAVDVDTDGAVRVEVADIAPGSGWPLEYSQRQWRGYRWTGDGFEQVSGPRAFGPNPHSADLGVTATDLVLTTEPDGTRSGSVTIRVRNTTDRTVPVGVLQIDLPTALRPTGGGWTGCDFNDDATLLVFCHLNSIEANSEVSRTLDLRVAAGASLSPGKVPLEVWPEGPGGKGRWLEPDISNNVSSFDYR
ncbi:hypothetical protein [Micromonospora sp. 067-2]|uniref:hypothetical protein n=1 Tax=Micromonospora sp. 067-2 TaxID=2789270 RepID=UPI00397AD0C4